MFQLFYWQYSKPVLIVPEFLLATWEEQTDAPICTHKVRSPSAEEVRKGRIDTIAPRLQHLDNPRHEVKAQTPGGCRQCVAPRHCARLARDDPQGRGALRVPGEGQIGCPTPSPALHWGPAAATIIGPRRVLLDPRRTQFQFPIHRYRIQFRSPSGPRSPRPPEVCCLLTAGFGCEVGTLTTTAFVWKRAAGLPARRAGFCWMRHRIWLRATCGQNRTAGFLGKNSRYVISPTASVSHTLGNSTASANSKHWFTTSFLQLEGATK